MRPATIAEAELFGIAPGAELFELERLRTLDDLPVALDLRSSCRWRWTRRCRRLDWYSASLYSGSLRRGTRR